MDNKPIKKEKAGKDVVIPPCNSCEKENCDETCEYLGKTYIDRFTCPECGSDRICITEYR